MSFPSYQTDATSNTSPSTIEAGIWMNLKAGDKKALSYFYTKYFDSLYNYGSKITKDRGLTEDSIQDLFIEVWTKREGLGQVTNVKYYLYKSLRRKIIYRLKLLARLPTDELDSFDIQLSHKSHYLSQQIDSDIRQNIIQLIGTLNPKQKEAIFLVYYEELSYHETAVIMGLKVKTVYNLIHLAFSNLRQNKDKVTHPGFLSLLL